MVRNLTALAAASVVASAFPCRDALAQACPGQVQRVTHTDRLPATAPPIVNEVLSIPQFDPSAGQVVSARIELLATLTGSFSIENLMPGYGPTVHWHVAAGVSVAYPSGVHPDWNTTLSVGGSEQLAGYDGSLDFLPPSGATHTDLFARAGQSVRIDDPLLLAGVFTGTGDLAFTASTTELSGMSGPGNVAVVFQDDVSFAVQVTYEYCPSGTITSLCPGDGSLATACPCGNAGAIGRGCENSASTGGALLTASGGVAPDTLVLSQSGELAGSLSIFLQGDALVADGAVFGDGVRCAGGDLLRLYMQTASAGAVTAPAAGDPTVTARSAALGDPIAAGEPRFYQVYYRDPDAAFCPGATFNVGNALRVVW